MLTREQAITLIVRRQDAGPGASGNYIEAIKINCGHDNVITNIIAVKSKATISKPDAK